VSAIKHRTSTYEGKDGRDERGMATLRIHCDRTRNILPPPLTLKHLLYMRTGPTGASAMGGNTTIHHGKAPGV